MSRKRISDEKRNDVIRLLESGNQTRKEVAINLNLPYSTVVTIYAEFLKHNKIQDKSKQFLK
jgi:DNA invertase Pin-like site-specific DNA recombinase